MRIIFGIILAAGLSSAQAVPALLASYKIASGANNIGRTQSGANSCSSGSPSASGACSNGSTGATISSTFLSTPSVGHYIAVWCLGTNSADFTSAGGVTDNQSNTYTNVAGASSHPGGGVAFWYVKLGTASGTFTVTCTASSSAGFLTMFIYELAGVASASPTDGSNTAGGSGTAMSPGAITTTNANDGVFGACANSGGSTVTFTANTGFTIRVQQTNSSSFYAGASEDQLVTATGTYTASITDSASGTWICGAVALKST